MRIKEQIPPIVNSRYQKIIIELKTSCSSMSFLFSKKYCSIGCQVPLNHYCSMVTTSNELCDVMHDAAGIRRAGSAAIDSCVRSLRTL